jgi:hypothetical protein
VASRRRRRLHHPVELTPPPRMEPRMELPTKRCHLVSSDKTPYRTASDVCSRRPNPLLPR